MLLMKEISAQNLSIWAEQGKLKLAFGEQSPQASLVEQIKASKDELVSFLTDKNIDSAQAFKSFMQSLNKPANNIVSVCPANSLQQGFIYHHLNQPDDDAYRVQMMLDYLEPINVPLYQKAWQLTLQRFPALRTFFNWDESLLQVVTAKPSIDESNFKFVDFSAYPAQERDVKIDELQQQDRQQGFDLSKPGLLRITLIKQSEQLYTMLKTEHHSISDGWSAPLLLRSVHEYYHQLLLGETPKVQVETAYLATQQYYQDTQAQTQQYWQATKQRFGSANDINGMLSAPLDLSAPLQVTQPDSQHLLIKGQRFKALKTMCQNSGVTLNVALQFCWHKLIQVYAGDEQTIVGTVVSGRNLPVEGIEQSVGLFINTLPLHVEWPSDATCEQVMAQIQLSIASLNSASSIALAELQPKGTRLFHTLFTFENYPISHHGDTRKWQMRKVVEKIDYPLSIVATEQGEELEVTLNYSANWLDAIKAKALIAQLDSLLQQLGYSPSKKHLALCLLDKAQTTQITEQWQQSQATYNLDTDAAGLIEQHARNTPNKVALKAGSVSLSYEQLNNRANALAAKIEQHYASQGLSIEPDTLVALYLKPSIETLVAMFAVLKLGAGYVPVSPDAPKERVLFMLTDINTRLVLSQSQFDSQLTDWLTESDVAHIACDREAQHADTASTFERSAVSLSSLAYVIYTSGTTGTPKGVMIEQGQLLNYFNAVQQTLGDALEVTDFSTNYCFDLTVTTTLCPLMAGGTVCIYQDDIGNVSAYQAHIRDNQVRFVKTTPSLASILLADSGIILKRLMLGGEALTKQVIDKLACVSEQIIDEYGPTEATVGAMHKLVDSNKTVNGIGQAYANVTLYVLNEGLQPVPVGAIGELYIGGAGVARGYLNRDDLTEERFIANLFAKQGEAANQRLYKTGDLVRWLANGEMEYLGRNDSQMKVRGYRIELGEIESVLGATKGVQNVAVVADKTGQEAVLRAYWVSEPNAQVHVQSLKETADASLPDYMVPSSFTELAQLPLTANGKLDQNALPKPEQTQTRDYVAPTNELQRQLCQLWQEVLMVDKVGIHDNFYELGGNSITAIRLSAQSRKRLKRDIPLEMLFKNNTVAKLAKVIESQAALVIPRSEQAMPPLSFAQERLLFIDAFERGGRAYHIPALFKVGDDLNLDLLQQALNQVVSRHSVLNTVFKANDEDTYSQHVLDTPVLIKKHVLSEPEILVDVVQTFANSAFDLANESPMRVYHIQSGDERYLLFVWHHIAFDGWSTFVFTEELTKLYLANLKGERLTLPELSISYADYASWQRDYLQGERLTRLQDYWLGQLKDHETLALPYDKVRPENVRYEGQNIDIGLTTELSELVRQCAKAQQTSIYTVMLSAFYVTLASVSGQQDIVIGTPSDNRHHVQVQALVGFFVNSLALRTYVDKNASFDAFIKQVHELVTQAKIHQELPFERVVELLELERDASRHPVFQVMFSVQSVDAKAIATQGVTLEPVMGELLNAHVAKHDLTLLVDDSAEQFSLQFNFATSLFERPTIEAMAKRYIRLLESMLSAPNKSLNCYDMLSEEERQCVLYDWNEQRVAMQSPLSIQRIFEQQVAQNADKVAVVCDDEQLSYAELNQRANKLARHIRQRYEAHHHCAITPDTLIALYCSQSIEMLVATFAVLKAGAAYVPLSTDNPQERTRFILDDAHVNLIITETELENDVHAWFDGGAAPVVLVESQDVAENDTDLDIDNQLHDLAYVIYTSGTTGQPKGVEIEHHAVSSFALNNNYLDASKVSNIVSMSSYAFDGFIFDAMFSLLNGLCVHLTDKHTRLSPLLFAQYIAQNKIDASFMTTALFNALAASDCLKDSQLKHILFGGEAVNLRVVSEFMQTTPQVKLSHVYGPTETTVFASVCHLDSTMTNAPIGHGLMGKSLYVLDEHGNPVPAGTPGELYIGGLGLARGYLNRPELTREKFVANPFADEHSGEETRMYRTGDIVKWLPNGLIEYIARNDNQVKIRGFRIELSEIESAITAIEDVEQAAVIACENDAGKYIATYVVTQPNSVLSGEQIIAMLQDQLPDFMVPSAINLIDRIPLNTNGKLDRKALPEPEFVGGSSYVAPRDPLEQKLCDIWQDTLVRSQIGIQDDYFNLGGTSIAAIKLMKLINQQLNCDLSIADLFTERTIAGLANLLRNQTRDGRLLKRLNTFKEGLPTLVMVHAGSAGCEVYQGLANELTGSFNCFGIDNYNLLKADKISELDKLAEVYYAELKANIELEDLTLLGWSLGGNIALEIAYNLEHNHGTKANVLLLDTIVKSGRLRELTHLFEADNEQQLVERMLELGHDKANVEAMLLAREADGQLDLCSLSGALEHTQVHLLKAGLFDLNVATQLAHEWTEILTATADNNVREFIGKKITTQLVEERHHGDILQETALIKEALEHAFK